MIASEGQTPQDESRSVDHFPSAGFYGGHTLMREGFQNYQVQGVEFYHLGQGDVIGPLSGSLSYGPERPAAIPEPQIRRNLHRR
ncbi:MAG: hypothetical protein ACJ72H_27655 [Candidatus Sulfotelmatobacter sp.]